MKTSGAWFFASVLFGALTLILFFTGINIEIGRNADFLGRSMTVGNIPSMNFRTNCFIGAGFSMLGSILCAAVGYLAKQKEDTQSVPGSGLSKDYLSSADHRRPTSTQTEFPNEPSTRKPDSQMFSGNSVLENAVYKEFLITYYNIRRNDVMNEIIFGEDSFPSVEEALYKADISYKNLLQEKFLKQGPITRTMLNANTVTALERSGPKYLATARGKQAIHDLLSRGFTVEYNGNIIFGYYPPPSKGRYWAHKEDEFLTFAGSSFVQSCPTVTPV